MIVWQQMLSCSLETKSRIADVLAIELVTTFVGVTGLTNLLVTI